MSIKTFLDRHEWMRQLWRMFLASVGILIVVFLLIKLYARQGKEYELPDVVGLTLRQLEEDNPLDLQYVVLDSVYHPGEAGGVILAQTPKAGTQIKKARKIYLTVTANSPDDVECPELTSLTLRQAVNALERRSLQVGRLTFVESPYNVVDVYSSEGKRLSKGDKVPMGARIDLTVGLGDKETSSVVPFVIGKSVQQARADLYRASLNVGHEHFGGVKDKLTAVVVKQEPDYTGVSLYPFGTPVELWYADANTVDAAKLRRNFKVDSSKIIKPQHDMSADGAAPQTGERPEW
ncbi:MAG: PASTA domain-containing protein [Bacteroidales bacterium]|nr:PASTA domain-containing protein [Bacteroidales bacterium]